MPRAGPFLDEDQGGFAGAEAGGFVALGRLDIGIGGEDSCFGIDFLYKLFHDDWELQILSIFGWGHAELALELVAEGCRGKADVFRDFAQ